MQVKSVPTLLLKEPHTSHSTAVIKTASVVFLHVYHNKNNENGFIFSFLKPHHHQSSGQNIHSFQLNRFLSNLHCPPPSFIFSNVLDAKCSFVIISFAPHPSPLNRSMCSFLFYSAQPWCSALSNFSKPINVIFLTWFEAICANMCLVFETYRVYINLNWAISAVNCSCV